MSVSKSQQKSLRRLVRHFRILRGWKIRLIQDKKYAGEVSINASGKRAVIYVMRGKIAADFFEHEVLHCALRQLTVMDRRQPKEQRLAEEELVQDICRLIC